MSTLLWIGIVIVSAAGIIVIIVVIGNWWLTKQIIDGKKPRPSSRDSYLFYQRKRLGKMQRHKTPVHEIYKYAANEVNHILSAGDMETKMNWLNAWGLILNHVLKLDYTQEVWEKEGFDRLHIQVSEYAQQLSPKGLDIPFRPGFDADEIIARFESKHPDKKI
jgi:hypothetical protein